MHNVEPVWKEAIVLAELTNKRSICRAHLKGCENLKTTLSIQQWESLIKEILDEEQSEKGETEKQRETCREFRYTTGSRYKKVIGTRQIPFLYRKFLISRVSRYKTVLN